MYSHLASKINKETWGDILDYDFIKYLTKVIIFADPVSNCKIISKREEWVDFPDKKKYV